MKKNTTYLIFFMFIMSLCVFQSCEQYEIVQPELGFESFSASVQPIFTKDCASCHGGGLSPNLSDGSSFVSLTAGSYINLDSPEESEIIEKLNGSHKGYTSTPNVEVILAWIQAGAPND